MDAGHVRVNTPKETKGFVLVLTIWKLDLLGVGAGFAGLLRIDGFLGMRQKPELLDDAERGMRETSVP